MASREECDFAVVGGGAAGCVVAARLAESSSRSVVLLEAGPDLRTNVPDEFRDGWRLTPGFDWAMRRSRTRAVMSRTCEGASFSAEPPG
jgi:choline dehydrogenase-like flavoprotein